MFRFVLCLLLGSTCGPALAQSSDPAADHQALRKLKADAVAAVNTRDYAKARALLHEPFMATVITQDSFVGFDTLKAYFERLYTRDFLRMKQITMSADADELSKIYTGTFALTRGSTKEHYDLADGRSFDMPGRWTAVSLRDNGTWKLLAVHTGTNFLDNPVLSALEHRILWFAAAGAGGGLLVGFALGWLVRRARR